MARAWIVSLGCALSFVACNSDEQEPQANAGAFGGGASGQMSQGGVSGQLPQGGASGQMATGGTSGASGAMAGPMDAGSMLDASTSDSGNASDGGGVTMPMSPAGNRCPAGPFGDPLEGISAPREIMGGYLQSEGPVWVESEQAFYFTATDKPAITGRMHKYVPASGEITIFSEEVAANGLAIDPDGKILAGAQDRQQLARIDPVTGARSEVIGGTTFEGKVFNSPNDIVVREDGTIYFTDAEYYRDGRPGQAPIFGVYWITPEGMTTRFAMSRAPNGINLSPDGAWLYVSDTDTDPLRRFAVAADGEPGAPETVTTTPYAADGMAMDCAGNLYAGRPYGAAAPITIYAPDKSVIGTVGPFGEGVYNIAFGGADGKLMLVTSGGAIWEVDMSVPGLPN